MKRNCYPLLMTQASVKYIKKKKQRHSIHYMGGNIRNSYYASPRSIISIVNQVTKTDPLIVFKLSDKTI